jgi:MFS family permease
VTLGIMGLGTVGIGFLPTFATAGVVAPILLVLLRVLQGIAIGGEWGGAVLMAGEHAPKEKRTFFASFAQLGSPAGLILSLFAFRAVAAMDKEAFLAWGWRLPFIASAVLLVVGMVIRASVAESPEFEAVKAQHRTASLPVAEVVRNAWRTVLLCLGANVIGVAGAWFVNAFMLNYTTQTLGLDKATILNCLFIVAFIQLVNQLTAGWLAQRIGAGRFLKLAAALAIVSPYPMFILVTTGQPVAIVIGLALAVMCMSGSYAVMAGFMTEAFPVRVRYSGISLAYQLCAALAGGLTPLIGTLLAHSYAGKWWPLAVFYSTLSAITLVCIATLQRKKSVPPQAIGAAVPE